MRTVNTGRNVNPNAETNIALINKIYESFEALEETLGGLKLEEPLFITYVAKKAFAKAVFDDKRKRSKKKTCQ